MPVGSYYSTRSTYVPRSSSTSSYLLNRNTSLDRNSYSNYSSYGYGSSLKPPRSSYSSYSSESYRSKRQPSPAKSHSLTESDSISPNYGRYSSQRSASASVSSRYPLTSHLNDSPSSGSSTYSSRLRDRYSDVRNGNSNDIRGYNRSSPISTDYLSDSRNRKSVDRERNYDTGSSISERRRTIDTLDNGYFEKTSTRLSEELAARRKKDEDVISARRQRLGLSPIRSIQTKSPDHHSSETQSSSGYDSCAEDSDKGSYRNSNHLSPISRDYSQKKNRESNATNGTYESNTLEDNRDKQKSPVHSSSVTNGYKSLQHLDDPQCSAPSYRHSDGSRAERVRERIAKRLEKELDEDSSSKSSSKKGQFSENSGLVGLRNIGNTCFLNSIVQCLSNTRCLLEYLTKEGYASDINNSSGMRGELIRAFSSLIGEMWTEGEANRALNTGPFKSQIQKFAPAFSGYQQHDAQEFLRKLLEGLHEDVNRVTVRPKAILSDIDDDMSDDKKAMEAWKRYLRFDDSKIVDMFVGQLKSSLQCSVCSHTSVTFDPFWDLSLPIPSKSQNVKLHQCLDLFTKEEIMDGDERPTCSKCKERRKMTKSFSIQKFPKILVLHLKRFSPTERWRGKLSGTVEFPIEQLDLSRYASSSLSYSTYNLNGVANHSGTTYSGHYTGFCKHPYSGEWNEYNDSRVSSMNQKRICSPEAYVLFYELTASTSSKL